MTYENPFFVIGLAVVNAITATIALVGLHSAASTAAGVIWLIVAGLWAARGFSLLEKQQTAKRAAKTAENEKPSAPSDNTEETS